MPSLPAGSEAVPILLAAILLARARRSAPPVRVPRWLAEGAALPVTCGIVSALLLLWLFGGLDPVRTIQDEHSYILQAELLAHGRMAAAARPLPAFFEQYYTFVEPVTAGRYPPGWALALVPGIWLGAPALIPVLLTGLTALLLVAGVRRLAGPVVALTAWAIWMGMPGELRFRPTLLSEHLSTLLMLLGWWGLAEWRRAPGTRWLVLAGAATAWLGITRPLTGVAYALVAAAVILPAVVRRRAWRAALAAVAAGIPFVALVAWHDHAVTGSVFRTPLRAYSETYFPFDLPGYGLDTAPPRRVLPADMVRFAERTAPLHVTFTRDRLPAIVGERLAHLAPHFGGTFGLAALGALVVAGLVRGGPVARWGLAFAVAHFASYLLFAHQLTWTVYYLELDPVIAVVAALGAAALVPEGGALLLVTAWAAASWVLALPGGKEDRYLRAAPARAWAQQLRQLPAPAIVFVRDWPTHNPHDQLVANHYDLGRQPRWVVYDRGAENAALMALAPERRAWLYDASTATFSPLAPPAPSP